MREARAELIVIGGGPAGMAAAVAASRAGLREVVVIERHSELGGILRQCVHNGFGLHYFEAEMTGPEYAERLRAELAGHSGIRVELDTIVTDLTADRRMVTMNSREGITCWQAGAVIMAMGCRERPRGAINLPGTRPAGIFTAGTVQHLINLQGLLPGRSAVIVGSGDIGLIMARRLTLEGVKVEAVVELMPYPGGLTRNLVQCLEDFGIPLYLGHTITEIRGRDRVEGVTVAGVAGGGEPAGRSFDLTCDTLVLSVGLLPETELARMAGCELDPLTGGPVVDCRLQTSVPGLFSCGNVLHVHDLADEASVEGELAGLAAASFVLRQEAPVERTPVAIEGNLRSVVPQYLDLGRNNLLHLRVKRPEDRVALRIGQTVVRRFRRVKPAESIAFELKAGLYRPDADGRLHLSLAADGTPSRQQGAKNADRAASPNVITCIICPQSCLIAAEVTEDGLQVQGAACKRGGEYARREVTAPVRLVTSTVSIEGSKELLPVRSAEPIPKASVARAIEELRETAVVLPVKMGQIIVENLAGTGIPAIASRSMDS